MQSIEMYEVKAYSPADAIDVEYHKQHPNCKTSRGRDPRHPGIAGKFPKGTFIIVPGYNNDTATECDDTGAVIRRTDRLIEVRFQTEHEALDWGVRYIEITIERP